MAKLTEAFLEFIQDLKNVTKTILKSDYTNEEIQKEFLKTKDVDINDLHIFDIDVGRIYKDLSASSKKAVENHLRLLRNLVSEEQLGMIPLAGLINNTNLEKIAAIVSSYKESSDSIVDVLRKVVNSDEFEKVAIDLTKGLP